jgi:PPOX class probable F420-dependent enzyme
MELSDAITFARQNRRSVLTTIRANGRPQLSNVAHAVDDAGAVLISITADRAKYANLRREPWAALHVTREDFYAYVIIEGDVTLSPVAADPHDATVEGLIAQYRGIVGEHPDWDEFRQAMVRDRRVLVTVTPTRAYGML